MCMADDPSQSRGMLSTDATVFDSEGLSFKVAKLLAYRLSDGAAKKSQAESDYDGHPAKRSR